MQSRDPTKSIVEYISERGESGNNCGYCKSKDTKFSNGKFKNLSYVLWIKIIRKFY